MINKRSTRRKCDENLSYSNHDFSSTCVISFQMTRRILKNVGCFAFHRILILNLNTCKINTRHCCWWREKSMIRDVGSAQVQIWIDDTSNTSLHFTRLLFTSSVCMFALLRKVVGVKIKCICNWQTVRSVYKVERDAEKVLIRSMDDDFCTTYGLCTAQRSAKFCRAKLLSFISILFRYSMLLFVCQERLNLSTTTNPFVWSDICYSSFLVDSSESFVSHQLL